MRITLTHKGEIPGNKRPPEKIDAIRQDFHRQLSKLWGRNQLAILKTWLDSNFAAGAPDFRRVVGTYVYLPVVSEAIHTHARLTITLLAGVDVHRPAFANGDIDNRVKSLIDALAAPSQATQIPSSAPAVGTICLLSDDSLVDGLTIQTGPLLEENDPAVTLAIVVADVIPAGRVSIDTLDMVV